MLNNIEDKTLASNLYDLLTKKIEISNQRIENLKSEIEQQERYKKIIAKKITSLNNEIPKIKNALRKINFDGYEFTPFVHFIPKEKYNESKETTISVEIKCKMIGRRKPIGDTTTFSIKKWQSVNRINKKHQDKVSELGYRIMINRYTLNNSEQVKVILYL